MYVHIQINNSYISGGVGKKGVNVGMPRIKANDFLRNMRQRDDNTCYWMMIIRLAGGGIYFADARSE